MSVVLLKPPLYQSAYDEGLEHGLHRPLPAVRGRVTYYWPGESWEQSFDGFAPGGRAVTIGQPG
jgi:hypothetical protein